MRPMVALVGAAVSAALVTCVALATTQGGDAAALPKILYGALSPALPNGPAPARTPFDDRVRTALRTAAGAATVSAMVFDRQTGALLFEQDPDRRFRSASLVKLMIAIDALDQGSELATSPRLAKMLAVSDDPTASALWVKGGGGQIVRRVAAKLGLDARPPQPDGRWGNTLISARDVVKIYNYLLHHPHGEITKVLRAAPAEAADGFNQHFGIPRVFAELPWAIKQGWSAGGGSTELHTTGLVGENDRYIVVVLTETEGRADWGWATQMVTEATAALRPLLVR